jgi:hypothetical protein
MGGSGIKHGCRVADADMTGASAVSRSSLVLPGSDGYKSMVLGRCVCYAGAAVNPTMAIAS